MMAKGIKMVEDGKQETRRRKEETLLNPERTLATHLANDQSGPKEEEGQTELLNAQSTKMEDSSGKKEETKLAGTGNSIVKEVTSDGSVFMRVGYDPSSEDQTEPRYPTDTGKVSVTTQLQETKSNTEEMSDYSGYHKVAETGTNGGEAVEQYEVTREGKGREWVFVNSSGVELTNDIMFELD